MFSVYDNFTSLGILYQNTGPLCLRLLLATLVLLLFMCGLFIFLVLCVWTVLFSIMIFLKGRVIYFLLIDTYIFPIYDYDCLII